MTRRTVIEIEFDAETGDGAHGAVLQVLHAVHTLTGSDPAWITTLLYFAAAMSGHISGVPDSEQLRRFGLTLPDARKLVEDVLCPPPRRH